MPKKNEKGVQSKAKNTSPVIPDLFEAWIEKQPVKAARAKAGFAIVEQPW